MWFPHSLLITICIILITLISLGILIKIHLSKFIRRSSHPEASLFFLVLLGAQEQAAELNKKVVRVTKSVESFD